MERRWAVEGARYCASLRSRCEVQGCSTFLTSETSVRPHRSADALGILYFVPHFAKRELRIYAPEAPGRPPNPAERRQSAGDSSETMNAGTPLTTSILGAQEGMLVASPASQTPLWESDRCPIHLLIQQMNASFYSQTSAVIGRKTQNHAVLSRQR